LLFGQQQAGSFPTGYTVLQNLYVGEPLLGESHCLTDSAGFTVSITVKNYLLVKSKRGEHGFIGME